MAWAQLLPAQWGSRNFPYLAGGVLGSLFTGLVDFTTPPKAWLLQFLLFCNMNTCTPDTCTSTARTDAISSLFAFRSLSFFISIKYLD